MFVKEYYLDKYQYHKKLFDLEQNIFLGFFENLLYASSNFFLECSVKIISTRIYPCRLNIWYDNSNKNYRQNQDNIFDFIIKIEKEGNFETDYSLFNRILKNKMDFNKVEKIVLGVDFRKKIRDSRIKLWFIINQYPEKYKEVLAVHGWSESKKMLQLFNSSSLLFGFDFCFNGKSKIKIYPHFEPVLKDKSAVQKYEKFFGNKVYNLIKECSMVNLSFTPESKKIFHFHPNFKTKFVERINHFKTEHIYKKIKYPESLVVSLAEEEINAGSMQNINVYY